MNSRFLTVKLIALALAAAVIAFALGWRMGATSTAGEWLQQKYGPMRHSQYFEEFILRDFFADRRNGVFVDIGAAHYKKFSNTYYLENELGWSGLAVDPIREYAVDYQRYRRRTRFFSFFVSDSTGGFETLYIPSSNWWVASSDRSFVARWEPPARKDHVPVIRTC